MNALALVTNNNPTHIQLLFDRIIAIVSYDIELSVIFVGDCCVQLIENKIWKSLPLYGVENIYYFDNQFQQNKMLFNVQSISLNELKDLIIQAHIIL